MFSDLFGYLNSGIAGHIKLQDIDIKHVFFFYMVHNNIAVCKGLEINRDTSFLTIAFYFGFQMLHRMGPHVWENIWHLSDMIDTEYMVISRASHIEVSPKLEYLRLFIFLSGCFTLYII